MGETRAVIAANVASMRAEPKERAEQVSQAIFGETAIVMDSQGSYSLIRTPDQYEGWSPNHALSILETAEVYPDPRRAALIAPLFQPLYRDADFRSERLSMLTLGSIVQVSSEDSTGPLSRLQLPNGEYGFVNSDALIVPQYPTVNDLGPNLAIVAHGLVGTPYVWGGRTPYGIDCSGFVQRVYWLCGHTIPRDAYIQAKSEIFEPIAREDLKAGDLIFFAGDHDPRGRIITHVGLYFGQGRFIHAAGERGVSIMPLDAEPYGRQFWGARRLR